MSILLGESLRIAGRINMRNLSFSQLRRQPVLDMKVSELGVIRKFRGKELQTFLMNLVRFSTRSEVRKFASHALHEECYADIFTYLSRVLNDPPKEGDRVPILSHAKLKRMVRE